MIENGNVYVSMLLQIYESKIVPVSALLRIPTLSPTRRRARWRHELITSTAGRFSLLPSSKVRRMNGDDLLDQTLGLDGFPTGESISIDATLEPTCSSRTTSARTTACSVHMPLCCSRPRRADGCRAWAWPLALPRTVEICPAALRPSQLSVAIALSAGRIRSHADAAVGRSSFDGVPYLEPVATSAVASAATDRDDDSRARQSPSL